MHWMRVVSAVTICGVAILYSNKLFSAVEFDQLMTVDEQKKTGVAKLSDSQKKALEAWIDSKFVLKTAETHAATISLQENRMNGTQLLLSNNELYEIAPTDRAQASSWLSVIVTVSTSGDPNYPWKLTNTVTKTSVKGKLLPMTPPAQPVK